MSHLSLPDLLYHIAHDYPGAVPALAQRMNKVEGTLQKKLNPNLDSHGMNAEEIEMMVDFANANHRLARYFGDKADMLMVPKIVIHGSDTELLDGYMDIIKELGELSTKVQTSYADGAITARELVAIEQEGTDVMIRLASFIDRVRQISGKTES
jgi:hypothetical protein